MLVDVVYDEDEEVTVVDDMFDDISDDKLV